MKTKRETEIRQTSSHKRMDGRPPPKYEQLKNNENKRDRSLLQERVYLCSLLVTPLAYPRLTYSPATDNGTWICLDFLVDFVFGQMKRGHDPSTTRAILSDPTEVSDLCCIEKLFTRRRKNVKYLLARFNLAH